MVSISKYNCEDANYINVRFFLYFIAYKKRCSIVEVVEWLLTEKFENTINPYEVDEATGVYKTSDNLCEVNDNILKRILECGLVGFIVDIETEERECLRKLHYKIDALNRNRILKDLSLNFYQVKDFSYTLNPDDTVTSPTKDETDTVNELIDECRELTKECGLVIDKLKGTIEKQDKEMSKVLARQGYLDPSNEYFSIEMKLCHDTWNHCYNNGNVSAQANSQKVEDYLSTYPDFKVTSNATDRVKTIVNPKKKLIAGK